MNDALGPPHALARRASLLSPNFDGADMHLPITERARLASEAFQAQRAAARGAAA